MQQDAQNAKQLVVERVRQSTNILVAVSANPSVDALSSALGLALMLNKMDKHATAVFSGAIPQAMQFLDPGKTFENSVDSLRDFIISLDKDKADRLRYKVEDDVVRIFITPYRTVISQKDLDFSQGDFNVDLILALGVEKREELDKAIIAHGRILHDATVMTINPNSQQSSLGLVDWHDSNASSLSEMLVSMAEALQQPGLLDAQIATALLTGIVAATDRFSNEKTNPRVMTMAAQLMAAGANQQLIANNLTMAMQKPQVPPTGQLTEGSASIKVAEPPAEKPKEKGELDIDHPKKGDKDKKGKGDQAAKDAAEAEAELAAALPMAVGVAPETFEQLKTDIAAEAPAPVEAPAPPPAKRRPQKFLQEPKSTPGGEAVEPVPDDDDVPPQDEQAYLANSSWRGRRLEAPSMGGTLNATTEEAMDTARRAEEQERNHKILSHDSRQAKSKAAPVASPPPVAPPEPAPEVKEPEPPAPTPEPPVAEPEPAPLPPPAPEPVPTPEPEPMPAPAPEPEMPPAPLPPLPPAPEPVAPPEPAPAPEPAPLPPPPVPESPVEPPAPPPEPEPQLQPEQPHEPTMGGDVDAARQAVTDALETQPFNPAGQPLQSVGAMPFGGAGDTSQPPLPPPSEPVPAPELSPAPLDQPLPPPPLEPVHTPDTMQPPTLSTTPLPPPPPFNPAPLDAQQPGPAPADGALPPLPPLPPLPQSDPTQPLPPPPGLSDLPPLPSSIPPAPLATPPEPVPPAQTAPADPGQFQIPSGNSNQ